MDPARQQCDQQMSKTQNLSLVLNFTHTGIHILSLQNYYTIIIILAFFYLPRNKAIEESKFPGSRIETSRLEEESNNKFLVAFFLHC